MTGEGLAVSCPGVSALASTALDLQWPLLPSDAALFGLARGLFIWNDKTRFCGGQ
jgi:hypothetical protein